LHKAGQRRQVNAWSGRAQRMLDRGLDSALYRLRQALRVAEIDSLVGDALEVDIVQLEKWGERAAGAVPAEAGACLADRHRTARSDQGTGAGGLDQQAGAGNRNGRYDATQRDRGQRGRGIQHRLAACHGRG